MDTDIGEKKISKKGNEIISKDTIKIEGLPDRELVVYKYRNKKGLIQKREVLKKIKVKAPEPPPPPPKKRGRKVLESTKRREYIAKIRNYIYNDITYTNDLARIVEFIELLEINNEDKSDNESPESPESAEMD